MKKDEIMTKIRPLFKAYYKKFNKLKFVPKETKIGVGYPVYDEKEIMAVVSSLLDMRISQGKGVLEFEKQFAKYQQNIKYAVAVNSGSSANLLALTAFMELGYAKKGDEVIVPAATFTTVASPIIQLGLIPVFVDVKMDDYNIDPKEIVKAISPKTKIIMPVHSLGNPCDMFEIMKIAEMYNLLVLEDCCESHGAEFNGKKIGTFGDIATFSFFVAHNMTTGEGGMVLTNNPEYDKILRSLREFGRFNDPKVDRFDYKDEKLGWYDTRYVFTRLGYNMRMTDICAALGIEQLKKLDKMNTQRIKNANYYIQHLKEYERLIKLPIPLKGNKHTYYTFQLVARYGIPSRASIVTYLEAHGIETRPFFGGCLPDQPAFRYQQIRVVGKLPVSRYLRDNAFFIGCHPMIKSKERKHVADIFRKLFRISDEVERKWKLKLKKEQ